MVDHWWDHEDWRKAREEWLEPKRKRNKEILKALARGETLKSVAERFYLSVSRIQQIRDRRY